LATSPNSRFPELLQVQVPHGLKDALSKLADRTHKTPSEIARSAILNVVQLNGVSLPDRPH
jgi:predicted transcriptional regulator